MCEKRLLAFQGKILIETIASDFPEKLTVLCNFRLFLINKADTCHQEVGVKVSKLLNPLVFVHK